MWIPSRLGRLFIVCLFSLNIPLMLRFPSGEISRNVFFFFFIPRQRKLQLLNLIFPFKREGGDFAFCPPHVTLSPFCFKDLDNSDANERLKFSILKRLPEVCLRVCGQTLALFLKKKKKKRNAGPEAVLIYSSIRGRLKVLTQPLFPPPHISTNHL